MSGDRVGNDDDCRGSSSCLFKSVLPLAVGFMMLTFVLAVLYAVYKRYKNNKELRAMGKVSVTTKTIFLRIVSFLTNLQDVRFKLSGIILINIESWIMSNNLRFLSSGLQFITG